MTAHCKTCGQERFIKAAGMCRTCRDKHLAQQMMPIGDAKKRIHELINHYGNLNLVGSQVGIARNTVARIQHANLDDRITRAAYKAIMTHKVTSEPVKRASRWVDDNTITTADVAKYATTPEGRAFIAQCRGVAA